VPEIIRKHQYLFDMGYPYYMKALGNIVAITTDLGLCIFRIWLVKLKNIILNHIIYYGIIYKPNCLNYLPYA
jgi:hypothetical protein